MALKGAGGGSFGVITRLTFRTHDLPKSIGAVKGRLEADSDKAFSALVAQVLRQFRDKLCNPNWGEIMEFHGDRHIDISMVFPRCSMPSPWPLSPPVDHRSLKVYPVLIGTKRRPGRGMTPCGSPTPV